MNISQRNITVSGMKIDVVRKDIKNLHLGVYPPHGRIRVAVPLTVSDDAVRLAVITRLRWIKRQQTRFKCQDRQSKRDYVSGESHYFLGKRYRLQISEHNGRSKVAVRNASRIDLLTRGRSSKVERERIFMTWYRKELRLLAAPIIEAWAHKLDVPTPKWGIKRMKTKWGTCRIEARRIWLNLELIKKPAQCLEYIIVHELIHFLERHHNDHFVSLMDQHMPLWRHHRSVLNSAPLAHDDWQY
ncbi:MAG: M48 family metallopeptidase [Xanthobacteraceae bacterium]|nr:M48 family metallopeptidase [Xanthobacteraceae bacterium]